MPVLAYSVFSYFMLYSFYGFHSTNIDMILFAQSNILPNFTF